jgi:phospholipase C
VWNVLSKGIITAEGTPGPHFGLAKQYQGVLKAPSKFSLVPTSKTPYETLPPPNTDGTPLKRLERKGSAAGIACLKRNGQQKA